MAIMRQRDRLLNADEAAADDDNTFSDFRLRRNMRAKNHISAVMSGHRHREGLAPYRNNENVGPNLLHDRLVHAGIQPHLDPRAADLCNLRVTPPAHGPFKPDVVVREAQRAEPVAFFAKDDLMSPPLCNKRRLHAGRPAAGHKDPLMNIGRERMEYVAFAANDRVHRTAHHAVLYHAVLTLHAADAGRDLLTFSLHDLARQKGIGKKRPPHCDGVHAALRHKPLHIIGNIEGADSGDRCFDMLFDLRGETGVFHIVHKNRRKHIRVGLVDLLGCGGNMDKLDPSVKHLCDLHAGIKAVAALNALRAGDPDAHRKLPPNRRPDLLNDQEAKAHAVFKTSAPFILTVVRQRTYEFVDEPPMTGMDLHHVMGAGQRFSGRAKRPPGASGRQPIESSRPATAKFHAYIKEGAAVWQHPLYFFPGRADTSRLSYAFFFPSRAV